MQSSRMPGSRGRYVLDLDDIIAFPDIAHTPMVPPAVGEGWYIITEVVRDMSIMRPVFKVEDKLRGNYWMVGFYTDNPTEDAKGCVPGSLICIKNGRPHQFLDGQHGYRIEDSSSFITLPVSMNKLRDLNTALRERSNAGLLQTCVVCEEPVRHGCSKCKTRYCSQVCQRQDWPNHKGLCKALKTLHAWNRTEWF